VSAALCAGYAGATLYQRGVRNTRPAYAIKVIDTLGSLLRILKGPVGVQTLTD
jgi:hypothetical protein